MWVNLGSFRKLGPFCLNCPNLHVDLSIYLLTFSTIRPVMFSSFMSYIVNFCLLPFFSPFCQFG